MTSINCHYNFCHVVRTLRVTPAMQAGVVDHVWSLEEFMDACLVAKPCERPVAKPLVHTRPEGTARELPNNRGFLRVIDGGRGAPPPGLPSMPATTLREAPRRPVQLDLFSDIELVDDPTDPKK